MKMLIRAFVIIFTTALGAIMLTLVFEESLVFFPSRKLDADPRSIRLDFTDIRIPVSDSIQLHGWWVPGSAGAPVVLLLHGNAGNISHRLHLLDLLHRQDLSVCIIDYRGYGQSTGEPSESGLYDDARAACRWLMEYLGIPRDRLVVFGRSIGAAAAVDLAVREQVAGIILEGAFTNARDMALQYPLGFLLRYCMRTRMDNLSKITRIQAPLLMMHGTRDRVVPFALGRQLFEAAPEPKEFFAIEGGDHNDTHITAGRAYPLRIRDFISRVVK